MHSWGAVSLYLLDQGWARNSGRGVAGCKAFLYYFYVLDGGRMKAMLPKHGESTTERIKGKESIPCFVLMVASAEGKPLTVPRLSQTPATVHTEFKPTSFLDGQCSS